MASQDRPLSTTDSFSHLDTASGSPSHICQARVQWLLTKPQHTMHDALNPTHLHFQ